MKTVNQVKRTRKQRIRAFFQRKQKVPEHHYKNQKSFKTVQFFYSLSLLFGLLLFLLLLCLLLL